MTESDLRETEDVRAADAAPDAAHDVAPDAAPDAQPPGATETADDEVDAAVTVAAEADVVNAPIDVPVDEPEIEHLPGVLAARLTDPAQLRAAIEAVLFVVEAPVAVTTLAASLEQTTDAVQGAIDELRSAYAERGAGIELRDVAGGVRIFTNPDHAEVVEHFLRDGQRTRLSQAALETLAVIAYRQPVTRGRVSAIRGVNVDGVVRTLLARGLVVEVGTDAETGGGLYRTTELFLEKMGLQSLDDLPSLAPLLPDVEGLDNIDKLDGLDGSVDES